MFDAVQQPDIRKKLLFTAAMLVVFRFVAHIPIPGVDPRRLEKAFKSSNQLLGLFNLFSGGALRRLSVAALGVYPYITASRSSCSSSRRSFPSLQALQKEGEQGRHRLELYQHWMTVPLCFVQGYAQLVILHSQVQQTSPGAMFSPRSPATTRCRRSRRSSR